MRAGAVAGKALDPCWGARAPGQEKLSQAEPELTAKYLKWCTRVLALPLLPY